MAAPRKTKHSQAELARMAGVSTRTIRDWRNDGLDLDDVAAVMRRAASVARNDETLTEAKRRRAVAAADAEEIRVRRLKGELCETWVARGVIERLDSAVCTVWRQCPGELTNVLDGLAGGAMCDAIIQWVDHTLIPRFAAMVAAGLADLDAPIAELQKIAPRQP
jgi:hypothetical protein